MSESTNNDSDALGGLGEVMRGIRARLKADGPEVNYPALYAYVAGVLVEDERRLVRERIATWLDWHDAYWEIHAAVEGGEGSEGNEPEDVSVRLSPRHFQTVVSAQADTFRTTDGGREEGASAAASPLNLLHDLLRRAQQEPQAPLLSEEQRDCVRVLRGTPGLAMRELVERVGVWRTDRSRAPLSAARLSGSLQGADWLFQQVEVEVPAQGGVRGGASRVGGYRLTLEPELVLARTCGPLLARLASDPQARQALIDYATDLGVPESFLQDLRVAR